MDQHSVFEAHPNGSREHNIDLECPDQQRAHSPLVPIVNILGACPRRHGGSEQAHDVLAERDLIGRIEADPVVVTAIGRLVSPQHRQHEANKSRDQSGEDEAWRTAEGASRHRLERGVRVALLVSKLEGLVGAYEARQEGEDWHADATLPWYPNVRELQQSWRLILDIGGKEQVVIERSRNVGDDDEDRGDAPEALYDEHVSTGSDN